MVSATSTKAVGQVALIRLCPLTVFLEILKLHRNTSSASGRCQLIQPILLGSLEPTKLFHRPGRIPNFDHTFDFVLVIHAQKIDIVGMGFSVLIGRCALAELYKEEQSPC